MNRKFATGQIQSILHIGMGKCGSSALQTAFCMHPVSSSIDGSLVKYVAIQPNGSVVTGRQLTSAAAQRPLGYLSSAKAKDLKELSSKSIENIAQALENIVQPGDRLLLSKEGWCNELNVFKESNLLLHLNISCLVVAYVRPPVEWINSAWWQWGAWTGLPFEKWLKRNLVKVKWYDTLHPWLEINGVKKLVVRLMPKDIISDFCELADIKLLPSERSNTSLPASVLRLFQRHSFLRPGPHDSAIDFILSRHLKGIGGSPPWVLRPEHIELIIQETIESNNKLLCLLDSESRVAMQTDSRWWDARAYSDKLVEPTVINHMPPEALEDLAAQALQAIVKLDAENRKLMSKLQLCDEKN
jgi:hypothetical protein